MNAEDGLAALRDKVDALEKDMVAFRVNRQTELKKLIGDHDEAQALKESVIQALRERNEALQRENAALCKPYNKQWSVIIFALMAFGIIAAISIGDQFNTGGELNRKSVRIDKALEKLDQALTESELNNSLLATVSTTVSTLSNAQRVQQQDQHRESILLADRAIENLRRELETEVPRESAIEPIIDALLVMAYKIKASSLFSRRNYSELLDTAIELRKVAPDKDWETEHWLGIGKWMTRDKPDEVIGHFESSIRLKRIGNRDYLNLAEFALTHNEFHKAFLAAKNYQLIIKSTTDESINYKNRYWVVADLLRVLSGYISGDIDESVARKFLENEEYKAIRFSTFWDFSDVVKTLDEPINNLQKIGVREEADELDLIRQILNRIREQDDLVALAK